MFESNKIIQNSIIVTIAIIISFAVVAIDLPEQSFDSQKPKEISDEIWNSLKSAVQEAKLLPTPKGIGGEDSKFGKSVSVDGDRALVGAPNTVGHGAVYVLDLIDGLWVESAVLIPIDGEIDDQFGYSVSLKGNRALIGTRFDDDNGVESGSAYVFDLTAGSWSQTQKLIATDGMANDNFGVSVSLSADRALIGARGVDDNGSASGSAYIFDLTTGLWSQTQKLMASDGAASDQFGFSVSLSVNRALIGAYFDDDNGTNSGSAYVFDLTAGSWSQTQKLIASDSIENDEFGYTVSLSDNRALM